MKEQDKPPFPEHRTYYVVLKFVVMAAAAVLALYYFGVFGRWL